MLFRSQRKVILEIAEKESCVIIGRNADFILKDKDNEAFGTEHKKEIIQALEDAGYKPKQIRPNL